MQAITTIGLDIAKSVFQVHGIDAVGKVLPCLVGIEACASTRRACGVNEIAPGIRRDVKVGRANST